MRMHIYIYVCVYISLYVCIYIYICVYIYVCVYAHKSILVDLGYFCMNVILCHIYICVCIYINVSRSGIFLYECHFVSLHYM